MIITNNLVGFSQIPKVLKNNLKSFSFISSVQSLIVYFYILVMTRYSLTGEYALYRELIYVNDFTTAVSLFGFNLLIMREPKEFFYKNFISIIIIVISLSFLIFSIFACLKNLTLHTFIIGYVLLISSILYQFIFNLLVKFKKHTLAFIICIGSIIIVITGLYFLFESNNLSSNNVIYLRIIILFSFLFPVVFFNFKKLQLFSLSTIPAIKNILILAAPIGIGIVIGSFTQYIDKFLLSFLDTYQLAVYATASADIPFVGVIVINMSLYFMPAIQESYKNNSLEKTKKYISDLFLFGWYLNVIIFTLMFSNADYIIALLYTNKYIESVTIFKILSFSYLLRVVSYSHLIIALGLEKIIIKRMLIEMILQITVSIILLKIFGIYGLAFSAFLVLVFWSVPYNLNYINKVLKSKITEILPFKSMLTFFVKCFVPYYSLNYILISYTSLSRISSLIFSIGFLLIINNREIRYLLNNNK